MTTPFDQAATNLNPRADKLWYKDAIIYELHIRAFADSNGDGIGDFKGLISKLDYLSDLGVDTLWLLPFYPSPQKDDGYDISHYNSIHSMYGTLKDFKVFLDEAHLRGLRVITELVLNHTSDQHDWFQKSRRAKMGDPWRDFYVWSQNPQKYKGTRIIFKDYEVSNWTWDPVAKSYYWHRFYSHQPDLNFDNPEVVEKMFEVVDFWFSLGVDGMRLDAVPYLIEREGTSSENLYETHQLLKRLRYHVDQKFSDRMLLAEANQWPEDAVSYFGQGDECHMCFHFPLMPRLFMAIRLEDRFSIIDILNQTPEIPSLCQWALFLRNHDELTLEMVTDEERDYMYSTYAEDPRAQINLGIRHRLAPLLRNDRRQIELLNGILFSLPGTPVIYYGDEIGMGDNIFLGDRNGVRTPFQWTPDRNAGFSCADPQRLFLPTIISPEYHYETINVENQQRNSNSLLWWMKRLISHRKHLSSLSRGSFRFLMPKNTRVLTYLREFGDEKLLIVANLSRKVQFIELDLAEYQGLQPLEIFGGVQFPPIKTYPYFITIAPYAFYWFQLQKPDQFLERPTISSQANIELNRDANAFYELRRPSQKKKFEEHLLSHITSLRWFAGKAKNIDILKLVDVINLDDDLDVGKWALCIVEVSYLDRTRDTYLLTVGYDQLVNVKSLITQHENSVITKVIIADQLNAEGVFFDATVSPLFFEKIFKLLTNHSTFRSYREGLLGVNYFNSTLLSEFDEIPKPRYRGFEQSNSCMSYGNDFFLKLYRKIDVDQNPEVEVCRFLNENGFSKSPKINADLTIAHGAKSYNIGLIQSYIPNENDAWQMTVHYLANLCEELLAGHPMEGVEAFSENRSLTHRFALGIPSYIREHSSWYVGQIENMAKTISQMHLILGDFSNSGNFEPEELTPFYQRSMFQSLRNWTEKVFQSLRNLNITFDDETAEKISRLFKSRSIIYDRFNLLKSMPIGGYRIRCHGDLHLGQILYSGIDYVVIDFEGEPARTIHERRIKRSPLRDVAGMLRSFDYAAHHVLNSQVREDDKKRLKTFLSEWSISMQVEFLRHYKCEISESLLLPEKTDDFLYLTQCLLIEKVLYEIVYEANNRPVWLHIPIDGLLDLISA